METVAVFARLTHAVAGTALVGIFAFLLLVGRPAARAAGPDALVAFAALDARLLHLARWAAALLLGAALVDLFRQVTVASGLGPTASLTLDPVAAVLGRTRYGWVWLVRHALVVLLVGLLAFRQAEATLGDWLAFRLEALGLAAGALALGAAAGHAASADSPETSMVVQAVHLLASGTWLGGLVPLVLFLRWAGRLAAPGASRAAAAAARRFSGLGLVCVGLLVASGLHAAWRQVASFPALFGTPYGRWLLLKLGLLLPLVGVAAVNLLVLRPRLVQSVGNSAGARHLVTRLGGRVLAEAACGLAILVVVVVLGLTTPARHAPVAWPFSFRLSWDATKNLPGVQTRVAVGSQLAVLGAVAIFLGAIVPRRGRVLVVSGGLAALASGLSVALPPLAVDAYPTTYVRPTVPYTAAAISQGGALYRVHCLPCHGISGYGDGPAAVGLRPPPADLTSVHTADHTVGDMFWWISHGVPRSAMPGFADRLSEDDRWALISFVRTLAAAEQVRRLGSVVALKPLLVAPDFAYTAGVGEPQALKDSRGEVVLLVFFTLPESLDRLVRLAAIYSAARALGAQILAVPAREEPALYRRLGARPILFPFAAEGAMEAASGYAPFRRDPEDAGGGPDLRVAPHVEFLIDRQGYIRARWVAGARAGGEDSARLIAEIERLAREPSTARPPDEHVH